MSNKQLEENLADRLKGITEDIIKSQQHLIELQTINARQAQRIEDQEHRITTLNEVIADLEREKWSIQSELENLRGY